MGTKAVRGDSREQGDVEEKGSVGSSTDLGRWLVDLDLEKCSEYHLH